MNSLQLIVKKSSWQGEDTSASTAIGSVDDKLEKLRNIAEVLFKDCYYIMETKEINNELEFIRILAEKKMSIDVVAAKGEDIYDEFKNVLEKKYPNQFVGIDVDEGKIAKIAKTPFELLAELKKLNSDKRYYTRKIGSLSLLI